MHVYESKLDHVREYVEEGLQQTIEMPPMPVGDPFPLIDRLLKIECRLRFGECVDASKEMDAPYWADIVRLMQVFWAREWEADHPERLKELRAELVNTTYHPYVDARLHLKSRRANRGGIVNQKEP
jgi:thymidylate synthase